MGSASAEPTDANAHVRRDVIRKAVSVVLHCECGAAWRIRGLHETHCLEQYQEDLVEIVELAYLGGVLDGQRHG